MKVVSAYIAIVVVCSGCDPYPQVIWYNASGRQIVIEEDGRQNPIAVKQSVAIIPQDYRASISIIYDGKPATYHMDLPSLPFYDSPLFSGTDIYRFQVEPDRRIFVLPGRATFPMTDEIRQPAGFPLTPEN